MKGNCIKVVIYFRNLNMRVKLGYDWNTRARPSGKAQSCLKTKNIFFFLLSPPQGGNKLKNVVTKHKICSAAEFCNFFKVRMKFENKIGVGLFFFLIISKVATFPFHSHLEEVESEEQLHTAWI